MKLFSSVVLLVFSSVCSGNLSFAQTLSHRPATPHESAPETPATADPITVPLDVPAGTPVKIALDQEVRVRKVGQPIHGRVVEPVYAFDKLVIPAGTEATGKISAITSIPKKVRVMSALDADFSPTRQVHITFDELQLADGRRIPIRTEVTPGSNGVLQLVAADAKKPTKTQQARNVVSRQVHGAEDQLHKDLQMAKSQIDEPGKMHRLERLGMQQLPYRPQYMDAGTTFNADLLQPLRFGEESLSAESLSQIGQAPTSDILLHANLLTPLNSATSHKGEPVEAVITEPLFSSGQLVFPQGSRLEGTVVEVRPARHLNRNGLLRIEFQKIAPPNGIEQKITASLNAVEVAKKEHLVLDSEGGAEVTTPKTRYFATAFSVALAASSVSSDHDNDGVMHSGGDGGSGALTGASGFKLIGMIVGVAAHSRAVSSGLGFYGAGMSVYSHFLVRGHEVVYPKDMAMLIGVGAPKHAPDNGAMKTPTQSR